MSHAPTTTTSAALQRDMHLKILKARGRDLLAGMRILDFGCGRGATIDAYAESGFDSWGCDISFDAAPHPRARLIETPYRIPFESDSFDFVFSDQVFEHVQDYRSALSEIARVLRPGGCSLHIFPGPWRPIEAHTFVPMAGVLATPAWLRLWAHVGIRNGFQHGMSADEVANVNRKYLADQTSYPSRRQLLAAFGAAFVNIAFCEDAFFANTWGRARYLGPLARLPAMARIMSAAHTRAMVVAGPRF